VAIVNFGGGNLFNVIQACQAVELDAVVTQSAADLDNAHLLLVPGIGAFQPAMQFLQSSGLDASILRNVEKGKPLVGICLGMQLMVSESEEFGITRGLELIPGRVQALKSILSEKAKIPHTGWNCIKKSSSQTIMEDFVDKDFYFIHSYFVKTDNPEHEIGICRYGGVDFAASVGRDNIVGFQFHPELSGPNGLRLYQKFHDLACSG
jgi:glutamine amidotransferase